MPIKPLSRHRSPISSHLEIKDEMVPLANYPNSKFPKLRTQSIFHKNLANLEYMPSPQRKQKLNCAWS